LCVARWRSSTSFVAREAELNPVFERAGLPLPTVSVRVHSALTMITAAASSDLLAMLPQQWLEFAQNTKLPEQIKIEEQLQAPALYLITSLRLPLTPIAERLSDPFRKAVQNQKPG
jgi:DNA-binding transcriptional LysR family regulator